MPILPIIDLFILVGWTSLFGAFALKGVYIATHYTPTLFGMGPLDMVMASGISLLFAITLSARTWVKAHEAEVARATALKNAELEAYAPLLGADHMPAAPPGDPERLGPHRVVS